MATMTTMTTEEIEREVERLMALPYRVELTPDETGGWFVRLPDLPYCMSQGETAAEALEMIRDAQQGWLTVALEDGAPIPAPREPSYTGEEEFSGQFNVRLPKTLHRALVRAAKDEGVSLNLLVATLVARALGRRDVQARRRGRPPGPLPAAAGE